MHKDILQVFFPGQDSKEARLIDAKLKRLKMVGEGEAALQVSVFKSNSSRAGRGIWFHLAGGDLRSGRVACSSL